MKMIVAFLSAVFLAHSCFAWSEGGHHLIAVMAFDELTADQQSAVLDVLNAHPRFEEDFKIPEKVGDVERWLIGRAAYWPDLARRSSFDRPKWHYQLGASLVIGDVKGVPDNPGPLPEGATLDTKDLHIAQAIELCQKILKDKTLPKSDRAIALCWIGHLVGDAHQPCHAGSLYAEGIFPEGDRGANSIPTKQGKNLHALWDGLLGPKFDEGDIKRRTKEIRADGTIWKAATTAAPNPERMSPSVWLSESSELARKRVYTPEVLATIEKAGDKLESIDLTEQYLKAAGRTAQYRAAFAAMRLAEIFREDIAD